MRLQTPLRARRHHRLLWQLGWKKLAGICAAAIVLSSSTAAAVVVGDKVDAFTLPVAALPGAPASTLSLAETLAANRLTVLIFVATRCPYSNAYNGRMRDLATAMQTKGVAFVGINSNVTEPVIEIAEHRRDNKIPFPIVKDDKSAIANAFGATKTPEVYILDPAGTVVYHGRIDENFKEPDAVKYPDLKDALTALLQGRPVARPTTKAFGCSIKRSE